MKLDEAQAITVYPIEAVPKDGRYVFLWYGDNEINKPDDRPIAAFWHSASDCWCNVWNRFNGEGPFSPTGWSPIPRAVRHEST